MAASGFNRKEGESTVQEAFGKKCDKNKDRKNANSIVIPYETLLRETDLESECEDQEWKES
jgi:hypothetical protein